MSMFMNRIIIVIIIIILIIIIMVIIIIIISSSSSSRSSNICINVIIRCSVVKRRMIKDIVLS